MKVNIVFNNGQKTPLKWVKNVGEYKGNYLITRNSGNTEIIENNNDVVGIEINGCMYKIKNEVTV